MVDFPELFEEIDIDATYEFFWPIDEDSVLGGGVCLRLCTWDGERVCLIRYSRSQSENKNRECT